MQEFLDFRQAFFNLRNLGYSPIPLSVGDIRKPLIKKWQRYCDIQATDDAIKYWVSQWPQLNIGLACGFNGLVVVDIDDNDILDQTSRRLPSSPLGKKCNKGVNIFYRMNNPRSINFGRIVGKCKTPSIEVLGIGRNTTVPPSIHNITHVPYEWIGQLVAVNHLPIVDDGMLQICHDIVAERYGPAAFGLVGAPAPAMSTGLDVPPVWRTARGVEWARAAVRGEAGKLAAMDRDTGRANQLFASACGLGRYILHGVLPEAEITGALLEACRRNGLSSEEGEDSVRAQCASGFKKAFDNNDALPKIEASNPFDGIPATLPAGGSLTPIVTTVAPPPAPVPDPTLIAPPIPTESINLPWLFGQSAANYLQQVSDTTVSPIDYVIASFLVCGAVAIGGSTRINPTANWSEPMILRAALVGEPSARKSPAMRPFEDALRPIQEAEQHAWKQEAAARRKEGEDGPTVRSVADPDGLPAPRGLRATSDPRTDAEGNDLPPRKPYLIINNATPEKLSVQMQARNRGIAVITDELAGFLGSIGRYKKGQESSERSFYCESFNGRPYSVHRLTRDDVDVSNCCLSMLGPIVVDNCRAMLTSTTDGLTERFLMVWPAQRLIEKLTDEKRDDTWLCNLFMRLATGCERLSLTMAPETRRAFEAYCVETDRRAAAEQGLLAGALGKMAGQVARIAGALHLIDWAASGAIGSLPRTEVPVECVNRAVWLAGWFERHMRRIIGDMAKADDVSGAEALAIYIRANHAKGDVLNARKLRRKVGAKVPGSKDSKIFDEMLANLEAAEWISLIKQEEFAKIRLRDYIVN